MSMPMQYAAIFKGCKRLQFLDEKKKIFFLFLHKTDYGYMLEPPHLGGSNDYPQSMFKSKNKQIMYISFKHNFTTCTVDSEMFART